MKIIQIKDLSIIDITNKFNFLIPKCYDVYNDEYLVFRYWTLDVKQFKHYLHKYGKHLIKKNKTFLYILRDSSYIDINNILDKIDDISWDL